MPLLILTTGSWRATRTPSTWTLHLRALGAQMTLMIFPEPQEQLGSGHPFSIQPPPGHIIPLEKLIWPWDSSDPALSTSFMSSSCSLLYWAFGICLFYWRGLGLSTRTTPRRLWTQSQSLNRRLISSSRTGHHRLMNFRLRSIIQPQIFQLKLKSTYSCIWTQGLCVDSELPPPAGTNCPRTRSSGQKKYRLDFPSASRIIIHYKPPSDRQPAKDFYLYKNRYEWSRIPSESALLRAEYRKGYLLAVLDPEFWSSVSRTFHLLMLPLKLLGLLSWPIHEYGFCKLNYPATPSLACLRCEFTLGKKFKTLPQQ